MPTMTKTRNIPKLSPKQSQRFWSHVGRKGPNECWSWLAHCQGGYGYVGLGRQVYLAHRIAWSLTNGDIPPDFCVLHSCDNPPCCNPNHLFLGDQIANIKDRDKKKRGASHLGLLNGRAKLTPSDVLTIRTLGGKGRGQGKMKQETLASRFGITRATISAIVYRRLWPHLP